MSEDFTELRDETKNMIDGHETRDVEFKESLNGINSETFVAFANAKGGTILLGVREETDQNGMQRGRIIGCQGSFDDIRLAIQSKANSCRPNIQVHVARELDGTNYIYRIDIDEAQDKPCCTGGGRYCMRDSGSTRSIFPEEITAIVLEKESDKFIKQLQDAADKFVESLKNGQEALAKQIESVDEIVKKSLKAVEQATIAAEEAARSAEEASGAAQDAAAFSEEAASHY